MLKLLLPLGENSVKMVKNKRDLKSPRRNRSFTGSRPVARTRPSSNAGGNIRVVVRVRPPNNKEDGSNSRSIVKVVDDHTMVFDPKEEDEPFFYHGVQQRNRDIMKRANKNLHFTFDQVFGFDADNGAVFQNSTKCLIQTLMKGYNCSVFVYGATGAGKTHTMLGSGNDPGITFLTMKELFQQKDELSSERDFEIGMTYLEVYNETVQDLLNPGPALHLREDGKYGVIVAGIQVQRIDVPDKLFEFLEQGNRNRTQHPTDANAESSRSHAVFQVYLRMKFKTTGEVRVAKLSMIDLAGSERGAATGYTGARFAEGANINKSLLALGNCINSLADGHRHVPYRDSKLTRLLKDSLGGNCQTIMVANVSPSSLSYEDTYNTLKYAMRAKKIKSNMKKNVVNCEMNINHYVKLVDDLTKENEQLKLKLSLSQKICSCQETVVKEEPNVQLQAEPNVQLQAELQALYNDKLELERRVLHLESTKELMSLRKQMKEESDARLSGICSSTSEKDHGHLRLGNAVDRLERQAANVQQEIMTLRNRNEHIELRLKEFLQKAPHLQHVAEKEDTQIAYINANSKAEHLQKVCDLQAGELRMRDQLIERFSEVLQPCFLQLRGHGHATESLTASYRGLVRHLQGIRTVTWEDDLTSDSGMSSSTTLAPSSDESTIGQPKQPNFSDLDDTYLVPPSKPLAAEPAEQRIHKGAPSCDWDPINVNGTFVFSPKVDFVMEEPMHAVPLQEPEASNQGELQNVCAEDLMLKVYNLPVANNHGTPGLNRTTVLSSSKQNLISAKQLMTKVYKASPAKMPAKLKRMSPKIAKENKVFQPYLGSTTLRFGSAQGVYKTKITNKIHKVKTTPSIRPVTTGSRK